MCVVPSPTFLSYLHGNSSFVYISVTFAWSVLPPYKYIMYAKNRGGEQALCTQILPNLNIYTVPSLLCSAKGAIQVGGFKNKLGRRVVAVGFAPERFFYLNWIGWNLLMVEVALEVLVVHLLCWCFCVHKTYKKINYISNGKSKFKLGGSLFLYAPYNKCRDFQFSQLVIFIVNHLYGLDIKYLLHN